MKWQKLKNNLKVMKRRRKTNKYVAYIYYKCYSGKFKRIKQTPITKKEYNRLIKRYG